MTNSTGFNFASNYFLIELAGEEEIADFFKSFYLRLDTRVFVYFGSNGGIVVKEVYRLRPNVEPLKVLPYANWELSKGYQLLDDRGEKIQR